MTTPKEATHEALPEPVAKVLSWTNGSYHRNYELKWMESVPVGATLYTANQLHQALESERQAHAAEVERLRGDAERWNEWLPWLRRLNKKPFNLAKEIDAIDQAIARGKT